MSKRVKTKGGDRMNQEFIDSLELTKVSQWVENEKSVWIQFFANGFHMGIEMYIKNDKFIPRSVTHNTGRKCPFCNAGSSYYKCKPFKKYEYALFLRLIEFPKLRLHWLFLEHGPK